MKSRIQVSKAIETCSVQAFGRNILFRRQDENVYRITTNVFDHEPVTGMKPKQVRSIIAGLQELLAFFGDLEGDLEEPR